MVISSEQLLQAFEAPELCKAMLNQIHSSLKQPLRFMEVCGTHTVSIFRSGLRGLLPPGIVHLSGPGCPVCVTHSSEINAILELSTKSEVIIATFGDLMRVPGSKGNSLKKAQAEGARIEIVYSPFNALQLAQQNPGKQIVFIGIGFETTAPTVAATIQMAKSQNLKNFFVLCLHKLVPPALHALLQDTDANIDAFLLPGHVSTVIGVSPYSFLALNYKKPGIVAGFEPADILQSLLLIIQQLNSGQPAVINQYTRAASMDGNPKARSIMLDVFKPANAWWRGMGQLKDSGLQIRDEYAEFDAGKRFDLIKHIGVEEKSACKCGEVLKGKIIPPECPLFAQICTPANPVGPCMVSTEGSCAAYLKYDIG